MRRSVNFLISAMLVLLTGSIYGQIHQVGHFHKVIISPYIGATFIQGDQESVTISSSTVDTGKLNIETKDGVLRIFLDGAKDLPADVHKGAREKDHNYPKGAVAVTIVYRKLDALSLRGEESFVCQSPLSAGKFTLDLYGESAVILSAVHFDNMQTTIYGESSVDMQSGSVNTQRYTCYGEGKVNATAIAGEEAKLTAYGEAYFGLNVSQRIKITSFGESKLRYKGNPDIVKALHFGSIDIQRLD